MKRPALISLRVILLAAAICLASNAAAAPTLITTTHLGYPSGQLIGVNGVELEGSLYDVRFQNGSCLLAGVCEPQALFQGPIVDGFPVGDDGQSMALAASVALRDQVFGSFLAIGDYYQLPGAHLPSLWARGLPGVFILTPFGHTDTQAMFLVEGPSGASGVSGSPITYDVHPQVGFTYTVWTPEVAAIPEPETYAMLLAGLGLLGFAARRRKLKLVA